MDPTSVLLHVDQPHRTVDGCTAADPRRALVWAGKSIPHPSAHRPMDLSDLAVRFCHGSHHFRVSKILYSVSWRPHAPDPSAGLFGRFDTPLPGKQVPVLHAICSRTQIGS